MIDVYILIVMIILSMNERNSIMAQNFTNTNVTPTNNATIINNNKNTNTTNDVMDNSLSTGALVGLIIGLVVITTILVIIIFWFIRVRHLYLSQRHTKMYDPDMFQNSQIKNDTPFSYSSTSNQPISSFSVLPGSSNLQNKSMNLGQNTSLTNLQRQFLYPNINYSTYNNYTTENPLKMNTSMNVGSGERASCATISSQSPSWTDHHYFNTHHFNSAALFDGTSFNFYPYNQQTTTVMMTPKSTSPISPITTNEPKCNPIHIHPLESSGYIDPSPLPGSLSHSRLKSIAFISHLNAFGLKNKRRFSHLTKKSNKLKDNTTNRNIDSSHNYYNNNQTNPLPITENHESYSNAGILPDDFNFNTTESYDNDYFLYSLQTAIFNGFIPLNASNQQNTFHNCYKMSSPHVMSIAQTPLTTATTTTPTIHEESSHSFGEDLSLGNNNNFLTSSLSEYDSSKRNSRTFSPDFKQFSYNSTNSSVNNPSSNNNRFRFPPPGPPVAGWVNQLILKTNNLRIR
ncbi:tyrosine kinase [Schistosoma japonicum]|nr:tyrosine kinase [Schistosoma japonicum]